MKKLYRRIRYGEPVIVVSGLPRSGTSMAMQMLAAAGIQTVTDGIREENEDNPKGYFEDERVKELHRDGVDRTWLRSSRGKAVKVISFLINHLPEDNNYQVIFMRRELPEVLASQKKMLERRGQVDDTPDDRMLELWSDHLWKINSFMKKADHIESLEIPYRDVVGNAIGEARRIAEFLSRPLDTKKMAGAVDSKLYRNRT